MKISTYLIIFLLQISCMFQKSLFEQIQGAWAPSKDQNISLIIKKNKVIYPEDKSILNFKLNHNIMELSEEGHSISKWKISKVTSDSLFLKTEDSTAIKLVKIK